MKQKKLLFITSNNLASNPRLVKELRLAEKYYRCVVISFRLFNWSDNLSGTIEKEFPDVRFVSLSAGRKPFTAWLISSLLEKILKLVTPHLLTSAKWISFASSKRSWLLYQLLQTWDEKFDLIIAHNLPALFPSWYLANATNTPFGFDVEDYHPGETIKKGRVREVRRREYLLKTILPNTNYISHASPLILDYVKKLVVLNKVTETCFIPNCFSYKEFSEPPLNEMNRPLKLVWFSQKISYGRGLEMFLQVLRTFKGACELHLIGSIDPIFDANFIAGMQGIQIHPPLHPKALHASLQNYDVGLAIEMSKTDVNRNLVLTNKLYSYVQAGLYVLATDTLAQQDFILQNSWCGRLADQSFVALQESLRLLIHTKANIRSQAKERFAAARIFAWENQNKPLLYLWQKLA